MIISNREEYVNYRFHRAEESYEEALILAKEERWNAVINRLYYACFYAVGALLTKNNYSASSHKGMRQIFGQKFVKTGIIERDLAKHYTDLFEKRHKGEYNDFYDFEEETVLRLFPVSKLFIVRIEELLK